MFEENRLRVLLVDRKSICYLFFILILFLILFYPLTYQNAMESSSVDLEVPMYKMYIPENMQLIIWEICETNQLSYELVLAVCQIENTEISNIEVEIEKLAYYRNYWRLQGFPDEVVFDLMLISNQRGIEGCEVLMKDSDAFESDKYVQEVTEYKYYLEQI